MLSQLKDPESFRSKVFDRYMELIKIRKKQSAFHPNADFEILEIDTRVFAMAIYGKKQKIYAIEILLHKLFLSHCQRTWCLPEWKTLLQVKYAEQVHSG